MRSAEANAASAQIEQATENGAAARARQPWWRRVIGR
jgi:hypothetical protein